MFFSCRCASDNFSVPAEQTCLLYCLLYKEVSELPRQPWHHQPVDRPELVHLGLGGTTRNLLAAESGVSS
jgi:hypothetical protein